MSTAPNPTYYFLNERQEPTGPVTLETIGALVSSGHLPASVLVARIGDAAWIPYSARSAASSAPVEAPADGLPPKPASHMLWAVAVSIACCLPLGVVAIIKAASVDGHYTAGRYSEAVKASRSAAKWCIWGGAFGHTGQRHLRDAGALGRLFALIPEYTGVDWRGPNPASVATRVFQRQGRA